MTQFLGNGNSPAEVPTEFLTVAEQSDLTRTGRIDEVERLAAAFAKKWPNFVRSIEYGRSVENRPLRALLVTQTGALNARELREKDIPVLMLQGGIHPGESDGKDAGFIALRDMLLTQNAALRKIAVLFVPAFNTDGHERFARWNRPNQIGPEETGWRTTAQNLNLNRDYMKADAPEMQSMLKLLSEWDPLICADMHVTDGADFEPDISIQVEPIHQGDPSLFPAGVQLRDELIGKLKSAGSLPLPFYPDLFKTDDPSSGFLLTVYSARFSTGYFAARNRFSVLVETHSWKKYATRVRVTLNTIYGLADLTAQHGASWLAVAKRSDSNASAASGAEFALDFASGWREPTPGSPDARDAADEGSVEMIDFRGYAYTRTPSEISGDLVTTYDAETPQIWRVPFRKNTAPSLVVQAPARGYVVPVGFASEIVHRLKLHGVTVESLGAQTLEVEVFRASYVQFSRAPFEGRMRATLQGAWQRETREIPAGSILVPVNQPRARLLMGLLEPLAPDSFASWGFFNACFEQKEHIEPYVAEQIARDLIRGNAVLAAEFQSKLQSDPQFAANPAARLDFFLRRHTSWDDRFNLYPLYRL